MATLDPKDMILSPAIEKKIRILLGKGKAITKRQTKLLEDIISKAERGLSNKAIGEISSFGHINIFALPENATAMGEFNGNIAKMFDFGIQFTGKTPASAVKGLKEAMVQSSNGIVSKLGDDIRDDALKIINDGLEQSLLPEEVSTQLQDTLSISKARARTIARTETQRAAHNASFAQAKSIGMEHWIVDSRAEACEECQDTYDGQVYTIDETDDLPPLHPNCACIPVYYFDHEEATTAADDLSSERESQRQDLIDKGVTINKDGTSQNLNV